MNAVVSDIGLTVDEHWSSEQQNFFIDLVEEACASLAIRNSIPAEEIASWPFVDDLRIHPRGAQELLKAPYSMVLRLEDLESLSAMTSSTSNVLHSMQGGIQHLFVIAYNRDTQSFLHMSEAL